MNTTVTLSRPFSQPPTSNINLSFVACLQPAVVKGHCSRFNYVDGSWDNINRNVRLAQWQTVIRGISIEILVVGTTFKVRSLLMHFTTAGGKTCKSCLVSLLICRYAFLKSMANLVFYRQEQKRWKSQLESGTEIDATIRRRAGALYPLSPDLHKCRRRGRSATRRRPNSISKATLTSRDDWITLQTCPEVHSAYLFMK